MPARGGGLRSPGVWVTHLRMRRLALTASLVGAALVGCRAVPPAPESAARAAVRPAPGAVLPDPPIVERGLAVHLVWAGPADLDLIVTDPADETFSVEHRGDVVVGDVGCDQAARDGHGVETAGWQTPASGRYRVGVDFAAACGEPVAVPYRILIDQAGSRRAVDGTATPWQRTPTAVEVVVP